METLDISYPSMLILYGILAVPIGLSLLLKLKNVKPVLIAALRMTVQLAVVGFYLDVIFRLHNAWINFGWFVFMIVVANFSVTRNAGLKAKKFFPIVFCGLVVGSFFVLIAFIFLAIRPEPFYDARYLIPIGGMVVGNCMRANVISLERFYSSIKKNEREFLTYLLMGASLREAILPYLREAIKPALAPSIATMTTLGLVSLPGMMTGQILGGSSPIVAIKYQIAVMIAIFTAIMISTVVNILLSLKVAFNQYLVLKKDLFQKKS
jgi:putative ABC transport system permease protein